MVGELFFTITSVNPHRKILMPISTAVSSASLEGCFYQGHKNDNTEIKAETVTWSFGAHHVI